MFSLCIFFKQNIKTIFSSHVDLVIPARGRGTVSTGLSVAMPSGVYGRIAGRSGLAANCHISVAGGVIDTDYEGTVGVILFNHGSSDFAVVRGQRIAQMIFEHYCDEEVVMMPLNDEIRPTPTPLPKRRKNGFGSSGNF